MAQAHEQEVFEFHMIPSEPKEPGWQAFLQARETLLHGKPRSTARTLPILHRLTTHGVELEELPVPVIYEAGGQVFLDEGVSLQEAVNRIRYVLREGILRALNNGGRLNDKKYRIGIQRRGHLRSFGKRESDTDCTKFQTVFAPHMKPLDDLNFLGLAKDLEKILHQLCETYDRAIETAKTLDEKLAAIIFFQLWGASIIHPFWDANGRTFAAHLVLSLNQIGFVTDQMPAFPELHEVIAKNALAGIGPMFLGDFLTKNGLPLMTENEIVAISYDTTAKAAYMTALGTAIKKGIDAGTAFPEQFHPFRNGGIELLKAWLSREHLTDQGQYYNTRLPFFREQIAREEATRSNA